MVANMQLKIPASVYWNEVKTFVALDDVYHGIIKAFFFGIIIVTTACYKGFKCEGGAEGVGKATTSTVVVAMVLILVGDYFLSALLVTMRIGG